MGVVVDTCIWIDVERGNLSPGDVQQFTGENPVFITPVTIAELTFGVEMAASDTIRNRRIAALERLKKKPLLSMDADTGTVFGRIAATLRQKGRGADFRLQDLWIASIAIQHGFAVLTRNKKDFKDIPGLTLICIPK
ncbi:MAG: type II toxin-antitoxin system VapC family toxin [Deltaproteobacteria bacterium]|nr:type II toxin-antitoxin system VapC family toxin [Deltaproteobacteria bacterium]